MLEENVFNLVTCSTSKHSGTHFTSLDMLLKLFLLRFFVVAAFVQVQKAENGK